MTENPSNTKSRTSKTITALRWRKRIAGFRVIRLTERLMHMSTVEIAHNLHVRLRNLPVIQGFYLNHYRAQADAYTIEFVDRIGTNAKQQIKLEFDKLFFFGPSQKTVLVDRIKQRFPGKKEQTVQYAEAIIKDEIHLLGRAVRIQPGMIDWHADPVTRRRFWPLVHLNEAAAISVCGADVKYVWELNRHQFLPILGRAYWLTDDPRYAEAASSIISDWIVNNPFDHGVNWSSHLEVAMRAISWLWTMPFLISWDGLNERLLKNWLYSLAQHSYHLSKNLSIFSDPTNHLIGEATSLWMLSLCFPQLPNANKQFERTQKILNEELERQTFPDGVNKEQASAYHRFVLDFYLQVVALSKRIDKQLPAGLTQRVEAMLDYTAALAGMHGKAPMIGDSDDARAIPLLELVGWDFRDQLSIGCVIFERSDWKRRLDDLDEATVWLLGTTAIDIFDDLNERSAYQTPCIFAKGGYCFFGASSAKVNAELIFSTGPLGLWPNASHGHADALSIQIRVNDRFLLTDSGTGAYFSSGRIREKMRKTSAHNTLSVDGFDQADIYGTFKWVNPMQVRLLGAFVNERFSYAEAMHDGYQRLRNGVIHYRRIFSMHESGWWVVIDHLEGRGEHRYTRHFHFPPGVKLQPYGDSIVTAIDPPSEAGLRFHFPAISRSQTITVSMDGKGCWSERYGDWKPAPRMQLTSIARPPITLFVEISLVNKKSDPGGYSEGANKSVVTHLPGQARVYRKTNVRDKKKEEVLLVNPEYQDVRLPGGVRTDAAFLFLQLDGEKEIDKAFIVGEGRSASSKAFKLQCSAEDQYLEYFRAAS